MLSETIKYEVWKKNDNGWKYVTAYNAEQDAKNEAQWIWAYEIPAVVVKTVITKKMVDAFGAEEFQSMQ